MIVTYTITIIFSLISYVLGLLPTASSNTIDYITVQTIAFQSLISSAGWILPDGFLFIFTSMILLITIFFTWKASLWIIHNLSFGLIKK